MDVYIKHVPREILVHTVSLTPNKDEPDNVYLFRCYRCGTEVTQYKGRVIRISAGLEPCPDVTVIFKCYKCPAHYVFQTKPDSQKDHITLTLYAPIGTMNMFRCIMCRKPLLEYNTDVVKDTQTWEKVSIPHTFVCNSCSMKYQAIDIL